MSERNPVNLEDVIQVIVGSSALSLPVAFAEESWNLSRTLPMINIVLLILLSLLFINLYSIHSKFLQRIPLLNFLATSHNMSIVEIIAANRVAPITDQFRDRSAWKKTPQMCFLCFADRMPILVIISRQARIMTRSRVVIWISLMDAGVIIAKIR